MDFGPDPSEYREKSVGVFGGKFFPPHLGHIEAIEWAAVRVDVLFVVVQYDEAYEAELCAGTDFAPVSPRLRERWLSEQFRDRPDIRVFAAYEKRISGDYTASWLSDPEIGECYRELEAQCDHIDVVFSGDPAYTPYFKTWLPQAEHVITPPSPAFKPHATDIRRDGVFAHWDALPEPVQRYYTKRVAFCGWESAGKSYTAEHVAATLGTSSVPEYGRTYYERLNGYEDIACSQDALNTMAGHLHALDLARGRKVICVDTDLVYTQFYHRKDFGWMHPALDELIRANAEQIDEWIFLEPHNPLDDDGSRFRLQQQQRQRTSDELQQLYRSYGKPIHVIDEPDPTRRLEAALELVRGFIL